MPHPKLFLALAAAYATTAAISRGPFLGAPTPLQDAINSAIQSGQSSYTLSPSTLYTQGPSSLIITATDFTLFGSNSTLSFEPGYGVLVDNSKNVTLTALTITFSPTCFTQGTVIAHTGATTFDISLDPGYPAPNATYFTTVETKLQFFDGDTTLRPPQSGSCIVTVQTSPSPGVWRVGVAPGFGCDFPASTPHLKATISPRVFSFGYQIPDGYRGGAWWVFNSSYVTSSFITLYGSGNFAFTEWGGGGGHTYSNVRLAREGNNLLSSNTDGFHSFSVGLGPTLINSQLSFMGDDVLNFHDRVGLVLSISAQDTLQVIDVGDMPTPQGDTTHPARAFADIQGGGADALRLSSPSGIPRGNSSLPVSAITWNTDPTTTAAAKAAIASRPGVVVNPDGVGVWDMTLLGAGAAGVVVGDVVQFDRRSGVGARVQGCTFTDAYDSCFRLQSSDSLIFGNTWERIPGGLNVGFDSEWLEGASDIHNVIIQDNVFRAVLNPPTSSFASILHQDASVKDLVQSNNTAIPN